MDGIPRYSEIHIIITPKRKIPFLWPPRQENSMPKYALRIRPSCFEIIPRRGAKSIFITMFVMQIYFILYNQSLNGSQDIFSLYIEILVG